MQWVSAIGGMDFDLMTKKHNFLRKITHFGLIVSILLENNIIFFIPLQKS